MPLYEYRSAEDPGGTGGDSRSAFLVGALAGALAGALMVAIAWLGAAALGSEDSPPDHDAAGQAASSSTALPSTEDPSSAAPVNEDDSTTGLSRCREVFTAQSAPLEAAAVSLDQWEVHIGAMNKLVVGAISLQQATQFWNQTRVGASTNLKSFATAHEQFQQRTARCPVPSRTEAGASSELRACYRAIAARHQALRLATVSLDTWRHHVHHMEMLRMGEMTPQEATTLWLQSWRKGNDEVRAYREAARAAKGKTC
jgi:hypothetical protein